MQGSYHPYNLLSSIHEGETTMVTFVLVTPVMCVYALKVDGRKYLWAAPSGQVTAAYLTSNMRMEPSSYTIEGQEHTCVELSRRRT